MSDPSAAPNSSAQGFTGLGGQPPAAQAPAAPAAPPTPQAPAAPQLSDYGQQMLAAVPEAERAAVQKYVDQWDAGLQRQLAEVRSQYAPYEQYVGYDPEDLDMATRVWDMFNQDPAGTIEILQRAAAQQTGTQVPPQPAQGYPQPQPQYGANGTGQYGAQQQQGFVPQLQQQQQAQLPPEVMTMLQRQQQFMENMALTQQQQQQAQIEAQQDQEFEEYLDAMHRELGEFDDSIVINNMAGGMDPVQAVQAFRAQWQPVPQPGGQGGGQPAPPPPVPVLNGGSATPGQVPISQASTQQRHSIVKQMLDHANQS